MTTDYIIQQTHQIKNKHQTNDPFALCHDLGINLLPQALGKKSTSIKGFYLTFDGVRTITLNTDISDELQRVVLMHEIGHDTLHRDEAMIRTFHDISPFDMTSKYEYEANLFTAEYLLDDTAVLELFDQRFSFFETAARLHIPADLLTFKVHLLQHKGYELNDSPIQINSCYLR